MLPKSLRLKTEDFKNPRRAKATHTPHLLLRLFPWGAGTNLPPQAGKAAVIVSASTYKRAVDRNLLRRRIYHIIGMHLPVLQRQALTVTLKKGALDASFKELEVEFLGAVEQTVRRQ